LLKKHGEARVRIAWLPPAHLFSAPPKQRRTMKNLCILLVAGLFAVSSYAQGKKDSGTSTERSTEKGPDLPTKPSPGPDARGMPDSAPKDKDAPANSGMVVVPPKTGTEQTTVVTPPKNVDPGITAPTDEIDKKTREKSKEKTK
jgi:hypothetical protein